MARYSSRLSPFLRPPYENVDESYHEEAERYIDGKYLNPEGLVPATHWATYTIPQQLEDISLWYVRERYAADSMVNEGDVWYARKEENHKRRKEIEGEFNPAVQLWQTTAQNADTSDGSSRTARFRRA